MKTSSFLTVLALLTALFLPACGGGGGDTPAPVLSPPAVTTQPAPQTVDDGATANFSVAATSLTTLSYQWRKNGTNISGATADSIIVAAPYSDNGALYSVVVSNSDGSVTSADAALTVTPQAPTINTQPLSVSVQVGSAATFTVAVSGGTGPITYQWRRGGADIATATVATYTIAATALVDNAATFTVAIISPSGTQVSSIATLSVTSTAPPAITAQPQNRAVALGQTATFSVTASSGSAITYQWSRDGVAIAGASGASYTTAATVAADDGARFAVVATNAAGPTNSTPATLTISNLPPAIISQVSAGFFHSVVRKSDGSVWSWGTTGNGLRGVGSDPVTPALPTRAKNSDGTSFVGVVDVSAGYSHTMAVKGDGTVWGWGWGYNNCGVIGDGSLALRASPVQPKDAAGVPFTSAVQVSAGLHYTLALKSNGSVWAWGCGSYGRLGDGAAVSRLNPVAVVAPGGGAFNGVAKVAAGQNHSLALKTDGTVWAWGRNAYGNLGDGTTVNAAIPVRADITPGVALTGVVGISAGFEHSVAVKSDGTAYAWGYNASGQLSDGSTAARSRPTLVKDVAGNALNGIVAVAAGAYYSMFLKSDGTVWASGYNNLGQLGDNTTAANQVNASVVKDAAGATFGSANQISLSHYHTVVRRADGTVWFWGNNTYGQGDGTAIVNRRNPAQVPVSGP
jgi:alpha-tubulin suppressor-like RCC1 family protein